MRMKQILTWGSSSRVFFHRHQSLERQNQSDFSSSITPDPNFVNQWTALGCPLRCCWVQWGHYLLVLTLCLCGSVGIAGYTNPRQGSGKVWKKTQMSAWLFGKVPCGFYEVTSGKTDPAWPVFESRWNYHISSLDSRLKITPCWGKPSGKPVETKSRRRGNREQMVFSGKWSKGWWQPVSKSRGCAAGPKYLVSLQWMKN